MKNNRSSIIKELLLALVPYTEQNLKLSYKPGRFFDELGRKTGSSRGSLAATMSRARRLGYIADVDNVPHLTKQGMARIESITRKDLADGMWLLVSFDIPERRRNDRARLREFLALKGFTRLQASVWTSRQDCVDELKEAISELKLGQYIHILLATSIFGPNKDTSLPRE